MYKIIRINKIKMLCSKKENIKKWKQLNKRNKTLKKKNLNLKNLRKN